MKGKDMKTARYHLTREASLKWLEKPSIFNIASDELYELDEQAFSVLKKCAGETGCVPDNSEFRDYCLREMLLSEKAAIRKIPTRRSPIPSMRYLELHITDRCNLICKHCYLGAKRSVELDVSIAERVFKEFEEMQGLRILLTGGEPLLHSQFNEINAMLSDYEFRAILFTNGLLLTEKTIRRLKVHEIQVSIDGLETAHDYIRGKGAFMKTMHAVRMALDAGISVSVSTMVHSRNLGDFEAMDVMLKKIGIKDWTVDVPCLAGHLEHNPDLLPPLDIAGHYMKYGFGNGLHGGGDGFACGHHLMSIMSDGNAAKCSFYADDPLGHVSEGLETCWSRMEHVTLDRIDCDCALLDQCRGGCRYRAQRTAGSRHAKDPYRCAALLTDLQ